MSDKKRNWPQTILFKQIMDTILLDKIRLQSAPKRSYQIMEYNTKELKMLHKNAEKIINNFDKSRLYTKGSISIIAHFNTGNI
jgi:hypothetical protein